MAVMLILALAWRNCLSLAARRLLRTSAGCDIYYLSTAQGGGDVQRRLSATTKSRHFNMAHQENRCSSERRRRRQQLRA